MYIDLFQARNSSRFNVSTPCHSGEKFQHHAMTLSLYPPIPYFQASEHIVNVEVMNIMFLISTTFSVTHWRIFIQRWSSWLCQDWRCCGTHIFTLFSNWDSIFRKYLTKGVMSIEWFILKMKDPSLYVILLVKTRYNLMSCTQAIYFLPVEIPAESGFGCTIPDKYWFWQAGLLLLSCGVKGSHPVLEVQRTVAA